MTGNPRNAMVCAMPYLQNEFGGPGFFFLTFSVVILTSTSCKKHYQLTNGKPHSVYYLAIRFHVAVHLLSSRSQMTSKCDKNKNCTPLVPLFLPCFDVFCDLLLNRGTTTWNLFVLYNNKTNYYFNILSESRPLPICPQSHLT